MKEIGFFEGTVVIRNARTGSDKLVKDSTKRKPAGRKINMPRTCPPNLNDKDATSYTNDGKEKREHRIGISDCHGRLFRKA
jgi:hypothetical protein